MPVLAKPIDTSPVDAATAAAIEAAEARAWADCYAAAPARWAEEVGLGFTELGGALVLRWAATGRRYFSRAIGLGVIAPASEPAIDVILEGWRAAGIDMFLLQSLPHCEPEQYEGWLRKRGLEPFDAQDRVFRGGRPFAPAPQRVPDRAIEVERVTVATANEWVAFLERVYGLDTGPWLQHLVDRPGWHPYVAREGGDIVAARTMFIGPDGMAWLGMDGPVPGLTTDDYEPDAAICTTIVDDGLRLGATAFLADIEVPSDEMATPAYEYFPALGFGRPYVRTHWTVS